MKKLLYLITLCISLYSQDIKSEISTYRADIVNTDEYIKVSLIDVVLETVSQSNNAKAARERVRQAQLKIDAAKAEYLPSVNGTYKISQTDNQPGAEEDRHNYYNDESYKVTITQNLYKGGETSNEIKRLEKKYAVEKNKYKLVIAKEIENAIKAYFDVLFNFKSFNVNVENMDRLNEILEIVNIKYESGASSIGNLSNIKASVSNAESKLIKVQSKFNEALEYYEYIVGDEFLKTFPYEDDFDTSVDDFDKIIFKAIAQNKTIQNIKLNISAEKFNLKKTTALFKPKIDLELSGENILDQEDYENDEQNYKAQVLFSYNFYNKGKDKNKILTINSKIRELVYRQKEEIRKLKWTLSKLHRSIISITNANVSKKEEVVASEEMVGSYWDGFKLGEQDLQELLQGQRQLNSAQLELIDNKKSAITDYFKLLAGTGELLNYFRLDIDADNYIDFTKSDYKNLLQKELEEHSQDTISEINKIQDLDSIFQEDTNVTKDNIISSNTDLNSTLDMNSTITEDLNVTSIKTDVEIIKKDSISDLLNFKSLFLESDASKWTIWLHYFEKVYQALDFAKEKNISEKIFVFDTLANSQVKSNIAYNIFDTKELAIKSMEDLNVTIVNKQVINVGDIKSKYKNFENKKLQTKIKKVKKFQTDSAFKKKFLSSSKDSYTINITSFSSMKQAENLVKSEKIRKDSFIFTYGDENEWVKVVYGVFSSYEEANKALTELKNIKDKYEPVIEIIEIKQKLYDKYKDLKSNQVVKEVVESGIQKDDLETEFKIKFLSANEDSYTINLATLINLEEVNKFKKRYKNKLDLFVFKFGTEKIYYKVMSGIFSSAEEAKNAIANLDDNLQRNTPRLEKIEIKQKLYFKYNKTDSMEVK